MKIFNKQFGYSLLLVIILLSSMMTITLLMGRFTLSTIVSNREMRYSAQSLFTASSAMERALFALYRRGATNLKETEIPLYVGNNSQFSYTLSSENEKVQIKTKGIFHETERELSSTHEISDKEFHFETENLSFSAQDEETSCRDKSFYNSSTFPETELWRIEQESDAYGDCTLGPTQGGSVEFTIPTELKPATPYYISFRALYTDNQTENLSIFTDSQNVESNESSFPIPPNTYSFFTCAFSEPFQFSSSDIYLTLRATISPIILDWISFSPVPLKGFAPCDI